MRAIKTTYLGPTNNLSARISVRIHSLPVKRYSRHKWDQLDGEALHKAAALQYLADVVPDWGTNIVGGALDVDTYVFCFTS